MTSKTLAFLVKGLVLLENIKVQIMKTAPTKISDLGSLERVVYDLLFYLAKTGPHHVDEASKKPEFPECLPCK